MRGGVDDWEGEEEEEKIVGFVPGAWLVSVRLEGWSCVEDKVGSGNGARRTNVPGEIMIVIS